MRFNELSRHSDEHLPTLEDPEPEHDAVFVDPEIIGTGRLIYGRLLPEEESQLPPTPTTSRTSIPITRNRPAVTKHQQVPGGWDDAIEEPDGSAPISPPLTAHHEATPDPGNNEDEGESDMFQDALSGDDRQSLARETELPDPLALDTPAESSGRRLRSRTKVDYAKLNKGIRESETLPSPRGGKKKGSNALATFAAMTPTGYREPNAPENIHDQILICSTLKATIMTQADVPKNYSKTKKRQDFDDKWWPEMQKQYDSLVSKGVWTLVKRPDDIFVLPGQWVYDEKFPADKDPYARARWVVCGNRASQDSWDVEDLYAAVTNYTSLRVFVSLVAIRDLEWGQFDAVTAFLNADAEKDIWVEQPHGFNDGTRRVCKLNKALYGIKEAPLWWLRKATKVMKKLGFEQLTVDSCIFVRGDVILILYVDDKAVAAPTQAEVTAVGEEIGKEFEIKSLGTVKSFLGIQFVRDRPNRRIYMHQAPYIEKILKKFCDSPENMTTAATPWPHSCSLPTVWESDANAQHEWLQRTGSLNHLAVATRADIAHCVSRLSEANKGPSSAHHIPMKHLFRYLAGTIHLAMPLGGKVTIENLHLRGYSDAAFADDLVKRVSTGGHIIFIAEGAVHWKTKKQTIVATSSTEAEFMNLTPTGMSLLWIAKLLEELGLKQRKPLLLLTDSQNARINVLNPLNPARTRHIDIRYKWVIDRTTKGDFDLQLVTTEDMAADGLTKPLQKMKHAAFVKQLRMQFVG